MIISIHQPDYIPYIGFFYKMSKSDKFVFLDDCQFSNDNMHHWNRVKTPQGECRLKIPVKQHLGDTINIVETRDELQWKKKHLKTIEMNYSKAPFFKEIFPEFEALIIQNYKSLSEQNIAINMWIAEKFGMKAEFFKTSDMDIKTVNEERVIDICTALGGDVYISGNGAKAYQVDEHFTERGVKLVYTDYKSIEYKQLWGEFIPNLSIVDYMFNCGFDWDYVIKSVDKLNGIG